MRARDDSKLFPFDVGVAGALVGRQVKDERGEAFGKALEHFVLMELLAHSSYRELDYAIHFWRTKSGLEVDFILGDGEVAIEVKGTSRVDRRDLRALETFRTTYSPRAAIIVCNEKRERRHGELRILPLTSFLDELWSGGIIGP